MSYNKELVTLLNFLKMYISESDGVLKEKKYVYYEDTVELEYAGLKAEIKKLKGEVKKLKKESYKKCSDEILIKEVEKRGLICYNPKVEGKLGNFRQLEM